MISFIADAAFEASYVYWEIWNAVVGEVVACDKQLRNTIDRYTDR